MLLYREQEASCREGFLRGVDQVRGSGVRSDGIKISERSRKDTKGNVFITIYGTALQRLEVGRKSTMEVIFLLFMSTSKVSIDSGSLESALNDKKVHEMSARELIGGRSAA